MNRSGHGAAEKIAGGETCSVYRCPCGCIHVHIGAFTVRLAADTFQELTTVVREAGLSLGNEPSLARSH